MYYKDQLQTVAWKVKRKSIMQRDHFTCQECGDKKSKLNVHHKTYIDEKKAWEYPDSMLITLCENCHIKRHQRIGLIIERLGYMNNDQLYFTIDIVNMLHLTSKEGCLKTLEFLTSELKKEYNV